MLALINTALLLAILVGGVHLWRTTMATKEEANAKMDELDAKLDKISSETSALVAEVAALKEAAQNDDDVPDEFVQRIDTLLGKARNVDDLVTDVAPNPTPTPGPNDPQPQA